MVSRSSSCLSFVGSSRRRKKRPRDNQSDEMPKRGVIRGDSKIIGGGAGRWEVSK